MNLNVACHLNMVLYAICIIAARKHISANSVSCSRHHIFRIFQLGLADAAHNNGIYILICLYILYTYYFNLFLGKHCNLDYGSFVNLCISLL